MNTLQKKMVIFLFILAFLLALSTFKVLMVVMEKKERITGLSQEVTALTRKAKTLSDKLKEREEELTQAKLNIEDLTYKLADEKKRSESFETKYKAEKERGNELEANLNKLKVAMEAVTREKEKLALDIEKLKEENDFLSRDLKEVRQAKEALEGFVAEGKKEKETGTTVAMAVPTISSGRIVTIYPQGLLAIDVERDPQDKINPGKIVTAQKEIKLSKILSYIITLEAAEGEDLSGLKKNDLIKYVR